MKKQVTSIMVLISVLLTGCVGSNALTNKLMEFNIKVVDNRYARGGVNFALAPVYGVTTAGDYLVLNSIEFWAGKNPINGKTHIFDTKAETVIDLNENLDPVLKEAPL